MNLLFLAQVELHWPTVFSYITVQGLLLLSLGIIVGVLLGGVPGLTGNLGLALALPFTLFLGTVPALGLLIGIYKGGMFGGAISAIAFGIPGTPSSAPTVFDGYPMSKQGYPKKALSTAHYSGVSADIFSDVVLILTFAPLAAFALRMGPREMFALLTVALAILATFAGASLGRTLIAIGIGLLLGSVGSDPISGITRVTFDIPYLRGGIGIIPLIVGLFAMSEIMVLASNVYRDNLVARHDKASTITERLHTSSAKDDHISIKEWATLWRETLTGALCGTIIGAIPGPGGTLSSFTSYGVARGFKKNRGKFGTGHPGGVAAAEAADSATAGATLVPLFGLGIPGSANAALFAAALQIQGITPGPGMLRTGGNVVYAIFVTLLLGSLFMLVIVHFVIPMYGRLSSVNMRIMVPVLGVLAALGVYSVTVNRTAVVIMIAMGVIGFFLRRHNISIGAVIMAFVVGPPFEANFRRGLLLSGGDWTYWFASPLAVIFYVIGLVTAIYLYRVSKVSIRQELSTESLDD